MGVKRELRIALERKVNKRKASLETFERQATSVQQQIAETSRRIQELALDAVHGDRRKLAEQQALTQLKSAHELEAQNLELVTAVERAEIEKDEVELQKLLVAEAHESIIESIAELPRMAEQLSKVMEPAAVAFGAFKRKIDTAAKQALPLISRGNEKRVGTLSSRLRTAVYRGMRAQTASTFHAQGIDFLPAEPLEASTFDGVVAPVLEWLVSALEVDLHAESVKTPNRAHFRCNTNISGLFGLRLRFGEVVSLPLNDSDVRMLIERGDLEVVSEGENTGATA